MVKAPRSKGCRVCVQRRIKCDLTKPHCLRCQRANRECPGFETTKFVDEGPSLKTLYDVSSKERSHERQSSESSTSSSPHSEKHDESSTKRARQKRKPPTPINSENWVSGAFERNTMISIICPTAYQNQLLGDFIESMRQPVQAPTFRCHSIWLREVASRTDPLSCLTWAVRAISISHLGRRIRDTTLIETSRRVYGKALLKLNAALQDPVEGLSSDVLSATVILSFYEVFNCTDRHSWIKHAGGAGHLIRLRGPARHLKGVDRAVFAACRYTLILEAFHNRSACFLDAPEWRALSWQIHKDLQKESPENPALDAHEHFFQELTTHPGFLRVAVNAVANPHPDLARLRALYTTGHEHRAAYQNIYAHLVAENRSRGHEPTKTASCFNDTVFPVVYQYYDVHTASLYCGYWATLCAINISLIGLEARMTVAKQIEALGPEGRISGISSSIRNNPQLLSNPTVSSIPSRGSRPLWDAALSMGNAHLYVSENAAYAREICKSAEFLQQTQFVGPLFLVVSLRMALRMGITRREKEWVLNKLKDIGVDMGVARSEIDVYHSQRGESADVGGGGGEMESPLQHQQQTEGGWAQTQTTGIRRSSKQSTRAYGEGQGPGLGVGSGIETPGMGVVLPNATDDVNEGGEVGLDISGPPDSREPIPRYDPTLEDEPVRGGIGPPWGGSGGSGYNLDEGFVSEVNPIGGVSSGVVVGGSGELGNVGMSNFAGLGPEREDSAGLWRGSRGISEA